VAAIPLAGARRATLEMKARSNRMANPLGVGKEPRTLETAALGERGDAFLKRAFDLMFGSLAILLFSPVMIAVATAVRFNSEGPALFRQRRIGRHGIEFDLIKFRSMQHNCDDSAHREAAKRWFAGQAATDGFKLAADPRVTSVGRFIRRTSLDELPQLFNVIRGEMSLVGPRPMLPSDRPMYADWYFERERLRPGITGPWQVGGRDRTSAPEMMEMDIRYVREANLITDFAMLVATVPAVIGRAIARRAGSG
jgi:lipopolysaccharide/colanic/teichoic acid biosynthesis glycosyltransferase